MQIGASWPTASEICWGRAEHFGTLAYWADQTRRSRMPTHFRIGSNLAEEVAACSLGGHGVPAEIGLAAFRAVRDHGLIRLTPPPTRLELEACLREPVCAGQRLVRYRFASQRSERLAGALVGLSRMTIPNTPLALRDVLLTLPGIGLKTASWIVRNHTGSNAVAIVDVHVFRAGIASGLFDPNWRLPNDYLECERAFIDFAESALVPASLLDACIWEQVRQLGRHVEPVMAAVRRNRLEAMAQCRISFSKGGSNGHGDKVLANAVYANRL